MVRAFRILLIALLAWAAVAVVAHAEPPSQVEVALPEPTGASAIGVTDLHLIDPARRDPYVPARARELMASVWYPAAAGAAQPMRPWFSDRIARAYAAGLAELGPQVTGTWTVAPSHGRVDAAADRAGGRRPIVLFSPGLGMPREASTAQAEDLASHGFVVVALSHTYESMAVEFPDGRLVQNILPRAEDPDQSKTMIDLALRTRVADTRFVLDRLADLEPAALPEHLTEILDLSKIAMFGHSLGGATAAQAMHDDRRIAAGVNLDGSLWGSVVTEGVDRPFVLIGGSEHGRAQDPSWQRFWSVTRGPRMEFRLDGSQHHSFCDNQLIAPALAAGGVIPADFAATMVGTIDARNSLDLQRGYLRTFFDTTLGRFDNLPKAPATMLHPEMVPVP
ncbi:alpha/beta hydrolase family protein [Nocardia sp. NPDC127579]|uniref:alpha/beta hydrolase family protein n=1 Tax=Nocardia sp. NPDC127579 TaxID=3345402 RepID=UPI0036382D40